MNRSHRPAMRLEERIRDAEGDLFASVGVEVDVRFLELAQTDLRVRVLSHGSGPPLVLLHGVSLSAAVWGRCSTGLRAFSCSQLTFRAMACPTLSATHGALSAATRAG
jgi:pimeloyl-ACP methyl ester carboxylesterase